MATKRPKPKIGGGESMVRQSFRDEADINKILARYRTTGLAPMNTKTPLFADVSMMRDLKTSLDMVNSIGERIRELPAEARKLFNENRAEFEKVLEEGPIVANLRKLGMLPPEPEVSAAESGGEASPPVSPAGEGPAQ